MTKCSAVAGSAINILGTVLPLVMQVIAQHDESKKIEELKKSRTYIRVQFNEQAIAFRDFGKRYIQIVIQHLDEICAETDEAIQEIRDSKQNKVNQCHELENYQRECRKLIKDIHRMDEV